MKATGRLVNHDPQSRAYAAPRRTVRPVSWLHRRDAPILDQGGLGGCTGWTAANFLNCALARENRRRWNARTMGTATRYLDDSDGEHLYRLATEHDDFDWTYPPVDGGSSGLGAAKALHKQGVIDSYSWTFDFAQAIAWSQFQPTMLGILWTEPMSDPDERGIIHIGTESDLRRADDAGIGHELLWRGCRWDRKLARLTNQWEESWGLHGEALIPLDELETLVMDWHGDVCVPKVEKG